MKKLLKCSHLCKIFKKFKSYTSLHTKPGIPVITFRWVIALVFGLLSRTFKGGKKITWGMMSNPVKVKGVTSPATFDTASPMAVICDNIMDIYLVWIFSWVFFFFSFWLTTFGICAKYFWILTSERKSRFQWNEWCVDVCSVWGSHFSRAQFFWKGECMHDFENRYCEFQFICIHFIEAAQFYADKSVDRSMRVFVPLERV